MRIHLLLKIIDNHYYSWSKINPRRDFGAKFQWRFVTEIRFLFDDANVNQIGIIINTNRNKYH